MTAVLLLAGCSGTDAASVGSATGGGGGSGGGTGDSGAMPGDGGSLVTKTHTVSLGPITLQPGEERVVCMDRRLESTDTTDIVGISSELTEGGHHIVLYRSNATEETPAPVNCNSFRGFFSGTVPLYIAQKAQTSLDYPSGIAYTLPAAQMVRVEVHFLNTTQKPLDVSGTVHLKEARPGTVVDHANLLFYGTLNISIPPLSTITIGPKFHPFAATTPHIFGLTGHQHHRGIGVTIELASSATAAGTMLYDNKNWADPPLNVYDPPLTTSSGQGFRYACSYDNPTNQTLSFGEGFNEEMCFLWAYYYPDMGFEIGLDQ